jgi:hypothetical protein
MLSLSSRRRHVTNLAASIAACIGGLCCGYGGSVARAGLIAVDDAVLVSSATCDPVCSWASARRSTVAVASSRGFNGKGNKRFGPSDAIT